MPLPSFQPSQNSPLSARAHHFFAASLLLAAAALTGCSATPANTSANPTGEDFPSLLGTSHFNGETVSTLGANYTLPPDSHHSPRLHDIPNAGYTRSGHRAL